MRSHRRAVVRLRAPALLLALWVFLVAGAARAQHGAPVIEAGREAEVLALLSPYVLGGEVAAGHRLMDVAIRPAHIDVGVDGPDGARATLRLDHPDRAPRACERTASFALTRELPDGGPFAEAALDALAQAVRSNDRGSFWRLWAPVSAHARGGPDLVDWATDGVVLFAAVTVLLAFLASRQLRGGPRWHAWALAGIVLAGSFVRLALAPEAALDAWPWSRLLFVHRYVYFGPLLAAASRALRVRLYLTDVVFWASFAIASLTPLAAFASARHLLRGRGAALAAAFVLAALPIHVRFSRSDVEMIPSIALALTALSLALSAVRDPSRAVRWLSAAGAPALVVLAIFTRPENALLAPLCAGAALLGKPAAPPVRPAPLAGASRPFALFVSALCCAAGAAAVVSHVLESYGGQVGEGLSPRTAVRAVVALSSPRHNTLMNPAITPPLVAVLAAWGGALLWRRGDRSTAVLLAAWLCGYFGVHAYVLPEDVAMQARYHLHLAPPLVLLASPALAAAAAAGPRPWLGAAACALVAVSPLLHARFVRDVAFHDVQEHAFARGTRDAIPDGCTVLEYTGPGVGDHDARYPRIGSVLDHGTPRERWTVVRIGAPREDEAGSASADPLRPQARALVRTPPSCLFFYAGVPCRSHKRRAEPVAPACAAIEDALRLLPVADARFPKRPYDEHAAEGMGPSETDVPMTLYRVLGPKAAGHSP